MLQDGTTLVWSFYVKLVRVIRLNSLDLLAATADSLIANYSTY